MIKKCLGCGIQLQSENENQEGYIALANLDKGYCKRCFRLINYHEIPKEIHKSDNQKILDSLNKKKGFCFFICDLLNINYETFNYYNKITLDKCLIISKTDLLPSNLDFNKIQKWLRKIGIKENILFASCLKKNGIQTILNYIENLSSKNIYFVGMSNAGKSSLLNTLFAKKITVSNMPNTTKDFISFTALNKTIHDSVGFTYDVHFDYLKNNFFRSKDILKFKNMPLKKGASLYLENILRIEIFTNTDIGCCFSKNLVIKKIYSNNTLYLDKNNEDITVPGNTNIFIKGLGFFYLKKPATLKIYNVDKKLIEIMPSFFGN